MSFERHSSFTVIAEAPDPEILTPGESTRPEPPERRDSPGSSTPLAEGDGRPHFSGGGLADATASLASVRFAAQIPAEADGLGYFIATTNLSLDEQLGPETRDPVPEGFLQRSPRASDSLEDALPQQGMDESERPLVRER